jgi:hypothetical protein
MNKQEGTINALKINFIDSGVELTAISGHDSSIRKYYL